MLEGGGGGATGLLNKGGGSNRLPGLATKLQAAQVLTSNYYKDSEHLGPRTVSIIERVSFIQSSFTA